MSSHAWLVASGVAGLALVSACGRLGFEPLPTGPDGVEDAAIGGTGDGGLGGPTGDAAAIDAAQAACAAAIPVALGARVAVNTCDGLDRIPVCGARARREVVFRFTVPAAASYSARAWDPGTNNVSNSTGLLNAACTMSGPCAGILGTSFVAGQVVHFVVEAAASDCAAIEFEVTRP